MEMNMYRLFTAVDLSEEVKDSVCRICSGIPGGKWVEAAQLHLTMRFIGNADLSLFERIREGLAGVEAKPFELSLRGVGRFPPMRNPKVLWVGVETSETLVCLQHLVEQVLVKCGLAPEERKFFPHITIARLKDMPLSPVATFLVKNRFFSTPSFPVTEFHLYSSTLTLHGAIHHREATYPLKG